MDTNIKGVAIGDWQPEHTAPRDGTIVLIVRAGVDARAFTGYVNENGDWESHEEYFLREGRPTHWMRLPKPPQV
jgi:hypothetical protein